MSPKQIQLILYKNLAATIGISNAHELINIDW